MTSGTSAASMDAVRNNNTAQHVSQNEDAFYINSNENINAALVTQLLEGPKNYVSWRKGMIRSLRFKKKLGFIYGRVKGPLQDENLDEIDRWEQCNSAVLSWIANLVSKSIAGSLGHLDDASEAWEDLEIRFGGSNGPAVFAIQDEIYILNVGPSDLNVTGYYNELVRLWAEEDALNNHELCDLGAKCKIYDGKERARQSYEIPHGVK